MYRLDNVPWIEDHARKAVGDLTRFKVRGLGKNLPTEIMFGNEISPLIWRWKPQFFVLKVLREQSNSRYNNNGFGSYVRPSIWAIWLIFRLIRNGFNPFMGFMSGRTATLTSANQVGVPNFSKFGRDLRIMRTAGKSGLLLNDYSSFLEVRWMRHTNDSVITDFVVCPQSIGVLKAIINCFTTTLFPFLLDHKFSFRAFHKIVSQLPSWHPYRIALTQMDARANQDVALEDETSVSIQWKIGLTHQYQGKDLALGNAKNLFNSKNQLLKVGLSFEPAFDIWPKYLWRNQFSDFFQTPETLESRYERNGTFISSVNNLYHFIEEVLPQIEMNNTSSPQRPVFLGGNVDPILEELAVCTSIAPVTFVRDEERLIFGELSIFKQEDFRAQLSSGLRVEMEEHSNLIRSALSRVRLIHSQYGYPNERICIVRRNGLQRRLANVKSLHKALKKMGFVLVEFETLTLSQRVGLLSRCAVLVGESGAGLAHAYLLNPNTKVVEIRHPSMAGSLEHLTLTLTNGVQYEVVEGLHESTLAKFAYGKDCFKVNIHSVAKAIER